MSRTEITAAQRLVCASGWLATTPTDFQTAVIERCIWQRVDPQVTLTHGGDAAGGMIGIVSGSVGIISAIGPSDTPLAHIARAPFWFGERPTMGQPRTITVVSRTVCDIALLPQKGIEAVMAGHSEWLRLLGNLSLNGTLLVTQIATDLLIANTKRRCVAVLLRIADCRTDGDGRYDAGAGQDELAAMANMSRQTIGTILRDLQASGLIELGYRTIAITEPAKLRAIVDV
nr:Crp/Fnr family transcriptional regulator [Polymorphobacter sp.]